MTHTSSYVISLLAVAVCVAAIFNDHFQRFNSNHLEWLFQIRWLLDGDEITDADIKYLDDGTTELLLQEALPDDEGVYTCIAENPLKRVMTSCRVSIDGE